jgi:hypothetical protein
LISLVTLFKKPFKSQRKTLNDEFSYKTSPRIRFPKAAATTSKEIRDQSVFNDPSLTGSVPQISGQQIPDIRIVFVGNVAVFRIVQLKVFVIGDPGIRLSGSGVGSFTSYSASAHLGSVNFFLFDFNFYFCVFWLCCTNYLSCYYFILFIFLFSMSSVCVHIVFSMLQLFEAYILIYSLSVEPVLYHILIYYVFWF